jgi:hypothetical protein
VSHKHRWPGHPDCVELSDTVCIWPTYDGDDHHLYGFMIAHDVAGDDRRCVGAITVAGRMTQQPPDALLKHALRLVGREVGLREAGRLLELVPGRRDDAAVLFEMASLVRSERLRLLTAAGVLESAEPWNR